MNPIQYISYEEALNVYEKTIEKSGGGFSGIRDQGGIESVLDFMQNDLYYPDFVSKLSYLVFRFCSGHFSMMVISVLRLHLGHISCIKMVTIGLLHSLCNEWRQLFIILPPPTLEMSFC